MIEHDHGVHTAESDEVLLENVVKSFATRENPLLSIAIASGLSLEDALGFLTLCLQCKVRFAPSNSI